MKKIKLFTFVMISASFVFVNCKKHKSEDPIPTPTNVNPTQYSIVGTWNWFEGYQIGTDDSLYSIGTIPNSKSLTFASGTYSANWSFAQMGTPPAANNDNGNYANNDSLILTSIVSNKSMRGKIIRLTANELWYRYRIYNGSRYEIRLTK
jgi:hypothetical protein